MMYLKVEDSSVVVLEGLSMWDNSMEQPLIQGGKLLEAQGWRLRWETGVFKQAARLHTFLFQGLIVLVGEVNGLVPGAHAFCPQPVGLVEDQLTNQLITAHKEGKGSKSCTSEK
ncbi:hypothetical protein INR49_009728 [Caranx melampygus]|nr:hypothetical protein INR49_009728 [Caranx melampygus]